MSQKKLTREALRKATLGTKRTVKKEIVKLNDLEFEIRQPTILERANLRKKCVTIEDGREVINVFDFLVWSVIENTYVPETDERVFDAADYDTLMQNPSGGFMDKFGEIASNLMNVDFDAKKNS